MLKSFDTNIALYAFVDTREPSKTTVARTLLEELRITGDGVISLQLLGEFSNVSTKRLRAFSSEVLLLQHLEVLKGFKTIAVSDEAINAAVRTHYRYRISFWDALLVEVARTGGAQVFFSQDLQHGMDINGIRVLSPFL